jgi:thiol-disulfide isomerase/thioredoxin
MKTAIALLLVCGFAAFSIKVKNELTRKESPLTAVKLNQPMPDFTLPDANGQMVKFNDVCREHKLVMINFWASWCTPCRMEMPQLERVYAENRADGFLLLSINEDEEREKADAYLKSKPVSFPVLMDKGGAVAKQLGIRAMPTTILVSQDGKVFHVAEGVEPYIQFMIGHQLKDKRHDK